MNPSQELAGLTPKTDFNRRDFVVTSLAAGFALSVLPVGAATLTTPSDGLTVGEVQVPVKDGQMPAYRAMPSTPGLQHPTILVVQEIFGVHEHIKDVCRRLAHLGYLAIAPELFARHADVSKITDAREIISQVISKVADAEVMSDLDSTVAWASRNGGDVERLGITGFCWGGRVTWLYSAHSEKVKAGVAWYGRLRSDVSANQPKHPIDLVKDLKAPVLGLYGGKDQAIPLTVVEEMKKSLTEHKNKSEFVIYPEGPHGFHADYRPSYREEMAKDGWKRLQDWFKRHGVAKG